MQCYTTCSCDSESEYYINIHPVDTWDTAAPVWFTPLCSCSVFVHIYSKAKAIVFSMHFIRGLYYSSIGHGCYKKSQLFWLLLFLAFSPNPNIYRFNQWSKQITMSLIKKSIVFERVVAMCWTCLCRFPHCVYPLWGINTGVLPK